METKLETVGSDNFYELKSSMLKGSDVIVEKICEESKELTISNEKLLIEQDKLQRVNIFANKQRFPHFPAVKVNRLADYVFLILKFDNNLPQNSTIFVNLTSGNQTQFCSKLIDDREITVEIPLVTEILKSTIDLSIDLVTFSEKDRPWCLIRNCIKEPTLRDRSRVRQLFNDKRKFIQAKLNALENLVQDEQTIDMKKLSYIKKSIRRDIPNL